MTSSIFRQIILTGMIVIVAFASINSYSYYKIKQLEQAYQQIVQHNAPVVAYAKELVGELWCMNALARGYLLTGDTGDLAAIQNSKQRYVATSGLIAAEQFSPEVAKVFGLMTMVATDFQKTLDAQVAIRNQLGLEEALKLLRLSSSKVNSINQVTDSFLSALSNEMQENIRQNEAEVQQLKLIMIVANSGIFIVSIGLFLQLKRRIGRPLAAVVAAADQIAAGDFQERRVNYAKNDEIGKLVNSFSAMRLQLRTIIEKIAAASEQVALSSEQLTSVAKQSAQAAGQVATAVGAVAGGANEQTASIEQTVLVTQNIVQGIRQVAAVAKTVSAKSSETAAAAQAGDRDVGQAAQQMEAIHISVTKSAEVVQLLGDSSKQIGEIVEVITGIADQTNLLALNAAIEAARAGEQGRGFAVVAEEVRKLAEESQEAARKIGKIVSNIQVETHKAVVTMQQGTDEVQRGTQVIAKTGEQFRRISSLVQGLNTEMLEFYTGTDKLAAAGDDVVYSVEKIKKVAIQTAGNTETISAAVEEQTAALEEISASSQALAKMAGELRQAIASFKL